MEEFPSTLLFPPLEYKAFMSGQRAIGYDPNYYEDDEGRVIIVNEFEYEESIGNRRFIVLKKWG